MSQPSPNPYDLSALVTVNSIMSGYVAESQGGVGAWLQINATVVKNGMKHP